MPRRGTIFEPDRIIIEAYLFAPGSCRKRLSIAAAEIVEVDSRQCTLRTSIELIYLPDWPRDELVEFCSHSPAPKWPRRVRPTEGRTGAELDGGRAPVSIFPVHR
jgi:hypothetical protein